jgi:AhpD family alkylhydroperoxidase
MVPRLNFYKSGPDAMKTMTSLEQHIARSGLDKSLVEMVRLRASQMNGCAYCIDVHPSRPQSLRKRTALISRRCVSRNPVL